MTDLIGDWREVAPKFVREGDVVLFAQDPHTVVYRQTRPRKGPLLRLESLRTRYRRRMYCETDSKVMRLHLPRQTAGPAKDWTMSCGDVVVYPAKEPRLTVAAIRHSAGWFTTLGPRSMRPDAQVFKDVVLGQALIVRSKNLRAEVPPTPPYRLGSVLAAKDRGVADPIVWVRIGPSDWKSSTGAEISDEMVRFEMKRRDTYRLLWAPSRQGER